MEKITLTGDNLTIEEVASVAKDYTQVELSEGAEKRLRDARQLVFDLVDTDFPIYGFNVGVGWNKDKKVFKEFFGQYNCNLIRSHSIGVPPWASTEQVRAIMLTRLNGMLSGCCGVAPEIPEMYTKLLNRHIHPMIPMRGSVGEADIGLLSHIGLAIIGEGNVEFGGKVMPSKEAFSLAGLEPLSLGPKDGLAIVSSNAVSAGHGALLLKDLEDFLKVADAIYALSLEGFNGNVSPLDDRNHKLRRYVGQQKVAARVREDLEGSFIYEPDRQKAVHDPLCYRDVPQIHGAVLELLQYTRERLEIQLNTTDDNPCVLLEEKTIVPSANFEPLNWVLGFESLGVALSHVSKASCLRLIKLSDPSFTNLPRFLSPAADVLCFCTVQKTYTSLDAEIRHLCNPVSMDTLSLAGGMEDMSTNAPYVVQKLDKILDNLRYIFALELIHAAQAVDYRKGRSLGKYSGAVYEKARSVIPFYDKDRNITEMIQQAHELIADGTLLSLLPRD